MYRMLVKKRTTTIGTGSFALTGGDLGNNGGRSAGINVSGGSVVSGDSPVFVSVESWR